MDLQKSHQKIIHEAVQDGSFERPFFTSSMTREEIEQTVLSEHPEAREIFERQELISVKYINKDGNFCEGQILADRELSNDVKDLFNFLIEQRFALDSITPIQNSKYNSTDEISMQDNNTSAFNFRYIDGTVRLSLHAFGFALDINPQDNPIQKDGVTLAPEGAQRNIEDSQVFTEDHPVVKWLIERGWEWGGNWENYQDYHHFQKPLATSEYLNELESQYSNGLITEDDYKQRVATAQKNGNS